MKILLGALCWLLPLFAHQAAAHRLAPFLLELNEEGEGRYRVAWQLPAAGAIGGIPALRLPPTCRVSAELLLGTVRTATGTALRWDGEIDCGAAALSGEVFGAEALSGKEQVVLLRASFLNGRSVSRLLTAEHPAIELPAAPEAWTAWRQYTLLGGKHILGGFDHLLFIFALLLLVRGLRSLVFTLTSFTLGHSLTLSLAALGIVRFPVNLAELGIAFSILVLAVELTRPAARRGFCGRRPAFGAGLFGLLHGMGFAGALAETGLPLREVPAALLGFNVGVELGQLAFVLLVLLAGALLRRLAPYAGSGRVRLASVYMLGSLAGLWCAERAAAVFGLG